MKFSLFNALKRSLGSEEQQSPKTHVIDKNKILISNTIVLWQQRKGQRGDVLLWHTHIDTYTLPPSSSPHMDPLLREKSYQGGVYVCFLWCECVCEHKRPVHQSGNRGHINLICHNLSLETLGPPLYPPTRAHTRWPPPECYRYLRRTERVRLITCES